MRGPRCIGHTLARTAAAIVGALAAALPAAIAAQDARPAPSAAVEPRWRVLLGIGGGGHAQVPGAGGDEGMVLAATGIRGRLRGALVGEALVLTHLPFAMGSDALLPCGRPRPGSDADCLNRDVADRVARADVFGSAQVRVGVEPALLGRWLRGRVMAGGGYMLEVARPFASVGGGLSAGGRRVRFTADVDHWWYRLPGVETELRFRTQPAALVVGRPSLRATSTYVRLGVEVPVGGWR